MQPHEKIALIDDAASFVGARELQINASDDTSGKKVLEEWKYISGGDVLAGKKLASFPWYGKWNIARDDQKVTAAPSGSSTGDVTATYLPWAFEHAFAIQPYSTSEMFFTAPLSGCCVMVCGPEDAPWIVHANYNPSYFGLLTEQERANPEADAHFRRRRLDGYMKWCKSIVEKLGVDESGRDPIVIFSPLFYQHIMGVAARVFGVKRQGSWRFFYNLSARRNRTWVDVTKPLYPTFDMLLDDVVTEDDESFTTVGKGTGVIKGYHTDGGIVLGSG